MRYTLTKAAGPFVGPRGGKWADAKHTIPWHEPEAAQHGSEHHYGAALRPVSHANVPKGARHAPHEAFRHGVAIYDKPLSEDEIRSFDLSPILNPAAVEQRVTRTLDELHEYAAEYRELLAKDPRTVEVTVRQALDRQGPGHYDIDAAVKRVIADLKGEAAKAHTFILDLIKAGPFIGPKGGKWADAAHTIPWKEVGHSWKGPQGDRKIVGTTAMPDGSSRYMVSTEGHALPELVHPKDLDAMQSREEKQAASRAAMQTRTAAVTKETAEAEAQRKDLRGFTQGMSPLAAARAVETLNKVRSIKGQLVPLRSFIEQAVGAGATVATTAHGRRLMTGSNTFFEEKDLSKLALDYAAHLSHSTAKAHAHILDLIKAGPFVGPRGGLWADPKHTVHWDPEQHGTDRLEAILADLVPSDQIKEIAAQLGKLTAGKHELMVADVKSKIQSISDRGEAVPMTLLRWQRVLDIVMPKGVPQALRGVSRERAAERAMQPSPAKKPAVDWWGVVNNFQTMPPADAVAKLTEMPADHFERMSEQLDEGAFESAAAAGRVLPHLAAWQKVFAQAKKARAPKPPAAKPAPAKPKKPQQQSFVLTPPAPKPEAPPAPAKPAVGEILQAVIDAAGRSPRALEEHIRQYTTTQLESVVARVIEYGDPILMAAVQRVLKKVAEEGEARQRLPVKPPPPAVPKKEQAPGWERMPEADAASARVAAEGAVGKRAVKKLEGLGWTFVDGAPKTLKEAGVDAGLTRAQARKVKDAGLRVVRNPNAAPLPEPAQPKSSVTEPKRPPKPREKKERETTRTGERKIKEVGEHIWGARRDLAAIAKELQEGRRTLSAEELGKMGYDDAAYLVTKQNLIPAHDLSVLKGLGMTPGGAHMSLAVVAAIRTKPDDTKTGRRQYVEDVRNVLASLKNCKTSDDVEELVQEWREQYQEAKGWTKVEAVEVSGYDSLEAARKRAAELTEKTGIEHGVMRSYSMGTFIGSKTPRPFEQFGSRFLSMLKNFSRDKFFRVARSEARAADEAADGWAYLQERSATKAAATKPEAGQTQRGFSEAQLYAHLQGKVERTGHTVNVKDANEKRVMKTFALTNVDFGKENYMAQADREFHTKAFEGAMHDFAETLGVDPGILSLNGRLGIAFGARGRGNASAHYESGKKVINITKFRGGGALAHEWGHALDNVIAEHFIPDTGSAEGRFLSSSPGSSQLPDKVRTAISKVMHAIEKHPDPERARAEHREFLSKLKTEAEAAITKHNDLVHEQSQLMNRPRTKEELEAQIDKYQQALMRNERDLASARETQQETRKQMGGRGMSYHDSLVRQGEHAVARFKGLIKDLEENGVLSPAQNDRLTALSREIDSARVIANHARKHFDLNRKLDPTQSRYSRSAEVLGKYWSRPWEKFARAFESFVHDELKDAGRSNSYLTGGKKTEADWSTGKPMPGGGEAQPYPRGEERKAIRLAMRELVETLKDTKIIEKALRTIFAIDLVKARAS